jgi:hypothetical protein
VKQNTEEYASQATPKLRERVMCVVQVLATVHCSTKTGRECTGTEMHRQQRYNTNYVTHLLGLMHGGRRQQPQTCVQVHKDLVEPVLLLLVCTTIRDTSHAIHRKLLI